jgi:hypothetical protein
LFVKNCGSGVHPLPAPSSFCGDDAHTSRLSFLQEKKDGVLAYTTGSNNESETLCGSFSFM